MTQLLPDWLNEAIILSTYSNQKPRDSLWVHITILHFHYTYSKNIKFQLESLSVTTISYDP